MLAGTVVLATACGSGTQVRSSQPATYQQFLAYSRCMHSHGAPFWPDPVVISSGVYDLPVGYQVTARILDQEQGPGWQAAVTSCQRLAPPGLPFTEQQMTSLRSELTELAACMRDHGIAGFPSPVVGPSGAGFPSPGPGVDQDSASFLAARQVCQGDQP
jgi:hypothetical protein